MRCQSWPFFGNLPKVNNAQKCIFLQMGTTFYTCILFLTWSTTHKFNHASLTYLFNLLWFYSFKIQIKSNKSYIVFQGWFVQWKNISYAANWRSTHAKAIWFEKNWIWEKNVILSIVDFGQISKNSQFWQCISPSILTLRGGSLTL